MKLSTSKSGTEFLSSVSQPEVLDMNPKVVRLFKIVLYCHFTILSPRAMTDRRLIVLVFYVGYIIFELPSNIILKTVGPAKWLSLLALAWGVIVIGMGYVKTWEAFAVLRAFLGVLEAVSYNLCTHPFLRLL
jgi:hypothetical protein